MIKERNAYLKMEAFLSFFIWTKGLKIALVWINSYCSIQFTFGSKMWKIYEH